MYSNDVEIKELINFANESKKDLDDDLFVERDDKKQLKMKSAERVVSFLFRDKDSIDCISLVLLYK